MTVEAISAIAADPVVGMPEISAPADVASTAFDALMQSFEALDARMQAGTEATAKLALGQTDNLHQIMISGEQTRLSFELMLAVRNKVLEAYQELMRMQV